MASALAPLSASLPTAAHHELLPPGPRSRVLNTLRYATDYVDAMRRWHDEFGPTFTLRDVAEVNIVTSDPELIQRVFAERRVESFDAAVPPSFDVLVGRRSLLMLPGVPHQQRRNVLGPGFCREALPEWAAAMVEATRSCFAGLRLGQHFVARERMRAITARIIGEVLFGAVGAIGEQIQAAMSAVLDRLNPRFLVARLTQREFGGRSAFGRFMQASRELDRLLLVHIAERRRSSGTSLLDVILTSVDDHGRGLDDDAVVEELRTLLVGGLETTSTTLAWMHYYVHRDPALLARVRAEVADLDQPSAWVRSALLGALIDETMRIRPVAGQIFRRLAEPMTLGRWQLPANVIVSPAPCLVHLRADLWPEPERFDPERFVAGRHPQPGTFLPFGGGSRRCIGAGLARFEAAVIFATALRELEFELTDVREPAWVRDGLPLAPAGGVPMRLVGRRTPA